ncbi:branched-chain amino acid ABC transporter permease [Roseovarius pacificus]|uniref:branched-chain amino acid ABC transporter permease n=1 Tax=Roseovarius pacificus TaxID=337701 RepID=UPI002A189948|nr:branched-chain amino acid ABC transporter permease [Roseovarius pacificus]
MSDFAIHVAIMCSLYGVLALSLNLQLGVAGLVNFGQIVLFGAGAYGAAFAFSNQLGIVAGVVSGLTFAIAIGLLFARLGRDLGGHYWGIATLAVAEAMRLLVQEGDTLTGGAQGISGLTPLFQGGSQREAALMTLALCVALLVLVYVLVRNLTASRYGLSLKILREEPQLAESLGYNPNALRTQVLMLAAAIAAVGGVIFAHYISFVGPDQLVAAETFLIWAMVVVGGTGNHLGTVLGAILMTSLFAFVPFAKDLLGLSSDYVAAIRLVLVGGGLLAFLLWRPQGILPEKVGGPRRG